MEDRHAERDQCGIVLRVALRDQRPDTGRWPPRRPRGQTGGAGLVALTGLLGYLWHEAGLDAWCPKMEGKRHWGVVSWHLREAAHGKTLGVRPLSVPGAPFYLDEQVHTRLFREHLAAVELIEDDTTGHPMVIAAVTITAEGHAAPERSRCSRRPPSGCRTAPDSSAGSSPRRSSTVAATPSPVAEQMYVPSPFRSEHRHEHAQDRLAAWEQPRRDQRLLLVVGEAKVIEAATYGHRLVVKHLNTPPTASASGSRSRASPGLPQRRPGHRTPGGQRHHRRAARGDTAHAGLQPAGVDRAGPGLQGAADRPGRPPRTGCDRDEVLRSLSGPYGRNARPGAMVALVCVTVDGRSAELTSQHLAEGLEEGRCGDTAADLGHRPAMEGVQHR
jgi:hypothetical protein